jgi:hypothetical protein
LNKPQAKWRIGAEETEIEQDAETDSETAEAELTIAA